jgi:hypothetical protein
VLLDLHEPAASVVFVEGLTSNEYLEHRRDLDYYREAMFRKPMLICSGSVPACYGGSTMGRTPLRRQETVLTLPSAPEFDEDGAWPPITTEWVPLEWELFESDGCTPATWVARELVNAQLVLAAEHPEVVPKSLFTEDPLGDDYLYEPVFSQSSAAANITRRARFIEWALHIEIGNERALDRAGRWEGTGRRPVLRDGKELRRVVHAARWQRQDPVVQLPPGSSHEVSHAVATGLTVQRCQTLADAVGLSIGGDATGIQARLSYGLRQELGFRVEITAQEERLKRLTLVNSSNIGSRRFALWHVDHRISIASLNIPVRRELSIGMHPAWMLQAELEFAMPGEPFVTYIDVDRV